MGFISAILNLFGHSGQAKNNNYKMSGEQKKEPEQPNNISNNEPVYITLTEEIIDATSDDDLLFLVFDSLSQKLTAEAEDDPETDWNRSEQAIYMIQALEAEVNNGGYNQFYSNPTGQLYPDLPAALKLVGANKFADLTQRANDTFEKEYTLITQHQDGTLEGFSKSYKDNPLNKFDGEFYDLYKTEDLQQLQVEYIRKHKTDFVNN